MNQPIYSVVIHSIPGFRFEDMNTCDSAMQTFLFHAWTVPGQNIESSVVQFNKKFGLPGERVKKHELYVAAFDGHLFITYFLQVGGGGVWPHPPDLLL